MVVLEQRGKAMRSIANRQGACEAGEHRGTPRHPLGKLSRQATSGVIAVVGLGCGYDLPVTRVRRRSSVCVIVHPFWPNYVMPGHETGGNVGVCSQRQHAKTCLDVDVIRAEAALPPARSPPSRGRPIWARIKYSRKTTWSVWGLQRKEKRNQPRSRLCCRYLKWCLDSCRHLSRQGTNSL